MRPEYVPGPLAPNTTRETSSESRFREDDDPRLVMPDELGICPWLTVIVPELESTERFQAKLCVEVTERLEAVPPVESIGRPTRVVAFGVEKKTS